MQLVFGLALVLAGSLLDVPPIVLIGLVLLIAEAIREVWRRRGLARVEYSRRLPVRRAVTGDALAFDITVWNRSGLPLAWLRAKDEVSPGLHVVQRELQRSGEVAALTNAWTLAPFERVTRHFHVVAERRGIYSFGPAQLEAGDLFARAASATTFEGIDRWIVRPRTVAVSIKERDDPWGGERRARHGLVDDPTRYAGARPYQPGDSLRSIHWRATARTGTPTSRIFEPGRHREVVVVLDLQTTPGVRWVSSFDDDMVESLCVAAASLVARLRRDGAEVGLAATGFAGSVRPFAYVVPAASDEQVGRCLDVLARLGSLPTVPVERVLTGLLRLVRPGASIIVLTARDPAVLAPVLRRVATSGHPVQVIALGEASGKAQVRRIGVDVRSARLDGPWQRATALVIQ